MRFRVIFSSLVAAIALACVSDRACLAESDNATKPLVAFTGPDSKIDQPAYELVKSKPDWINLWLRHTRKPPKKDYDEFYNPDRVPEVNFDKCMVIAIFSGKMTNVAALEAVSVTDGSTAIAFRFRERSYQTAGPNGGGKAATPYGLFIVPRSSKPVVVQEGNKEYKNSTETWDEVVRLRNAP